MRDLCDFDKSANALVELRLYIREKVAQCERLHASGEETYKIANTGPTNLKMILHWLEQPIMPEKPNDATLMRMGAVWRQCFYGGVTSDEENWNGMSLSQKDCMRKIYYAMHAALSTPPKPKMVTEWCISYTAAGDNVVQKYHNIIGAEDMLKYARQMQYSNISPIWSQEVEDK